MRDVSRRLKISLEDTISKDVREALRGALVAAKQPTTEAAAKAAMERVRAARVRAQVAQRMAADMQALQRDALLAQKAGLPTGKLARQVLSHLSGHPFHPADVKDDVPLVQPMATGLPSGPYVSSAQYNYWLGDHYHDEAGPPGVLVDSGDIIDKRPRPAAPAAEPAAAAADGGAGEQTEANTFEEARKDWSVRDNRLNLESRGVNVVTPPLWPEDAGSGP